mgnify:CR=1 FL=1
MTSINIPISERFDELNTYERMSINYLINEVAKHKLSFEDDEQGKRTKDINEALRILKGIWESERALFYSIAFHHMKVILLTKNSTGCYSMNKPVSLPSF